MEPSEEYELRLQGFDLQLPRGKGRGGYDELFFIKLNVTSGVYEIFSDNDIIYTYF